MLRVIEGKILTPLRAVCSLVILTSWTVIKNDQQFLGVMMAGGITLTCIFVITLCNEEFSIKVIQNASQIKNTLKRCPYSFTVQKLMQCNL